MTVTEPEPRALALPLIRVALVRMLIFSERPVLFPERVSVPAPTASVLPATELEIVPLSVRLLVFAFAVKRLVAVPLAVALPSKKLLVIVTALEELVAQLFELKSPKVVVPRFVVPILIS